MENGLNSQLSGFFSRNSHGPTVWKKISQYRDSGTHADEWLVVFKALLFISVVFTLGYGMALIYNLLLPMMGQVLAIIAALLFGIFLELGKVITGRWFFRDLFFGLFRQGVSSAGMILMALLISGSAFVWSYHNSTHGVEYLTKYVSHYLVQRATVEADTRDQDQKAAGATDAAQKGMGITWKGKTTREGQKIAANSTAIAAELEKQKTIKLQAAQEEQKRQDAHRDAYIDKVAYVLAMLGGKMEFFQLFLIIGIVFAEKTLYDRMKATGKIPTGAQVLTPPPPAFQQQNGAFYNTTTTAEQPTPPRPIGFNVGHDGNVHPRPVTGLPVSQSDTGQGLTEGAGSVIGPDEVIKLALRSIQAETANLRNGNGDPVTIKTRIREKITPLLRAINRPDFNGDRDLAERLLAYIEREYLPLANTSKPPQTNQQWELANSCAHAMNLLIVSLRKYIN